MVMYCENRESITILYTKKMGESGNFFTKEVPIDIECKNQTRTGKFIFTAKTSGFSDPTTCQTTGLLNIQSQFEADLYVITENATPVSNFENCPVQNLEFYIGTELIGSFRFSSSYQVSSIPNPNYSLGGKFLIVKNQQDKVLLSTEVRDCNFDVCCGQSSPQGSHKCTHNKYPEYYCVPCNKTGDRLKNIVNKVGR